jgi:hypothetical protein
VNIVGNNKKTLFVIFFVTTDRYITGSLFVVTEIFEGVDVRVGFRGLCGYMVVISIYRTAVTLRFPFAEVAVLEIFSVGTWVHCEAEAATALYNTPSIVLESGGWWATFMLLFEI